MGTEKQNRCALSQSRAGLCTVFAFFFFFLTAFLKYPSQTIFYTMYFTRKGILFVPHASGISCTKQQLLSRSRMLSHRL